jgi:Domain of unknown function (DUF4124)
MRKVALLLLIGCATLALSQTGMAAETWKWKDANGVVHYSDRPVAGAERVDVVAPKPSSSAPKPATAAPRAVTNADPDQPARQPANQAAIVPYTRCVITAPDNDETFNAVNSVTVEVLLEPALQTGHRIEVLLNGSVVQDWPQDAMGHTLKNLDRGSYTISARVLDGFGGAVCSGPTINFYVHLPTVPQVRATPH